MPAPPSRLTWLPNALTFARIGLAPLVVLAYAQAFIAAESEPSATRTASEIWIACALSAFGLAAVFDWADGFAARALKAQSELGSRLDPAADKILAAAGLVALLAFGSNGVYGADLAAPAFMLFARDALVAAARSHAVARGTAIPSSRLAKWKTAVELVALAGLIGAPLGPLVGWGGLTAQAGLIGLWLAAALAWASGAAYARAAWRA